MASQGTKGLERIIRATGYSWQGLKSAYRHEAAFRQEILLAIVLVPLGFWIGNTGIEKALLVSSVILVLIVELLNTGLEVIVDRIGDEQHKLSGRAKDIGSAAVFVSLLNVLVVWSFVLTDIFLISS